MRIPLILLITLLCGCLTTDGKIERYAQDAALPDFIAVLPPDNESTDMTAPDKYRRIMSSLLVGLGHFPVASVAEDVALRGIGISDGGQSRALSTGKVAETLGTDGVLYGVIEAFGTVNIAIYREKKVAFRTELRNRDSDTLWENSAVYAERQSILTNPIGETVIVGAVERIKGMVTDTVLMPEALGAASYLLQKTPEWPEPLPPTLKRIQRDIKRYGKSKK